MNERDITRIKQVTLRLMSQRKRRLELETELAEAVSKEHELEFDIIPTLMHELQIKDITLDGDIELRVGPFYRAAIPEANRPKAFDWLRKHNFGGIIKHEIKTTFTTEQDKAAQELTKILKEHGWNYDDREAVHHMTLTAFVKEQIEKGNAKLPLDLLGAFVGEKATLKLPKENANG
jgi:hypothetical protein